MNLSMHCEHWLLLMEKEMNNMSLYAIVRETKPKYKQEINYYHDKFRKFDRYKIQYSVQEESYIFLNQISEL